MTQVSKTLRLAINVGLDEASMPVHMDWVAEGSPDNPAPQECKGMLLSIFDKETLDTLKIDLWTKEMQVVEMDRFMFQTLRALGDTYFKATQNHELATDMQRFVQYFGERTEILPKTEAQ